MRTVLTVLCLIKLIIILALLQKVSELEVQVNSCMNSMKEIVPERESCDLTTKTCN